MQKSKRDKQIFIEMILTRLNVNLNQKLSFRIEWVRGKCWPRYKAQLGTNRAQTKTFEFEPVKPIQGQIEIKIKEKFEIQTII